MGINKRTKHELAGSRRASSGIYAFPLPMRHLLRYRSPCTMPHTGTRYQLSGTRYQVCTIPRPGTRSHTTSSEREQCVAKSSILGSRDASSKSAWQARIVDQDIPAQSWDIVYERDTPSSRLLHDDYRGRSRRLLHFPGELYVYSYGGSSIS